MAAGWLGAGTAFLSVMHDKPAPAWLMVIGGFVAVLILFAAIGVIVYVVVAVLRWLLGLPG